MAKKRYVVVGVGGRSRMFTEALAKDFRAHGDLVGLCDSNEGRLRLRLTELPADYPEVALYGADDFDCMIAEQKPDAVIVTTPDFLHDHYICRSLESGCDAITEKPMTIDAARCQRILDTVKKTGRKVRVTFNYRYAPPRSQVKELLMDGIVGKILSMDFHWMLDTTHGADYFRRWHRCKDNSGGLMVHKATHHFDLMNWWISSTPTEVFAQGKRAFYGDDMARRYGLEDRGERCHTCPAAERCHFRLDMAGNENMRKLYLEQERYNGYIRDKCVFGEGVTIEDTMNLCIRYRNNVMATYSLNAFMPYEGYVIAVNGTKGRLEHRTLESVYVSGDGRVPGATIPGASYIRHYPHFGEMREIEMRTGEGGHGGGDTVLLTDLFDVDAPADPLLRAADHVQGAWSILTGISANQSMATGQPVQVESLVNGLGQPAFTAMPE